MPSTNSARTVATISRASVPWRIVNDAERYRRIFALEEAGAWAASDREIAVLKDRLLMGNVLAIRYLGKSYRTTYPELAAWLAHLKAAAEAQG